MSDGINCKIVNNKCATRQQGSFGKCRMCEFGTQTRPVEIHLTGRDYQFMMDHCQVDGMSISDAATELVNQGIRSLRRHTTV
ncbi:MAG: hypothetical protein ABSB40_12720 [Nitrososphaeria archaeon]|jgi:hypothetical protein